MNKQDELRRRVSDLRAAIDAEREAPDRPSCVETALWRDLDAAEAALAAADATQAEKEKTP